MPTDLYRVRHSLSSPSPRCQRYLNLGDLVFLNLCDLRCQQCTRIKLGSKKLRYSSRQVTDLDEIH